MSPGLDFEAKIIVRSNTPTLLAHFLTKPGYQCEPICIGSNTDANEPTKPFRAQHGFGSAGLATVLTSSFDNHEGRIDVT